jgi:hypothetical protein
MMVWPFGARITQVQEAHNMLVHEVKPEETMVLTWRGMHGEIEAWRHAKCGQNNAKGQQSPAVAALP